MTTVKVEGTIGFDENMKATKEYNIQKRNDKDVKVPFMRFRMFADNNGNSKTTVYQVILPDNKFGESIFPYLLSGRRISVEGSLFHNPKVGYTKEGNPVAYANPTIRLEKINFLDMHPSKVADKFLNKMQELNQITDEQRLQFETVWNDEVEKLKPIIKENAQEKVMNEIADSDPNEMTGLVSNG